MKKYPFLIVLLAQAVLSQQVLSEEARAEKKQDYIRVTQDAGGKPLAMQTAVVRYVSDDEKQQGLFVDLVGAVHIGEASYYKQLNQEFKQYDALLYEIVAPEGTKIPKGGVKSNKSALSGLQGGMKDMLGLEFQLEKVDYTPENFVHADMTPEEFSKDMAESGDGFLQMMARAMGQSIVQQSKESNKGMDAKLIMALFSSNRELLLKQLFAEQMKDMEGQMRAIEGPNGSTLISSRNKKAFTVLKREIDNGKKKIGVFYGAGHFPDMHKRLVNDFHLKVESVRWIDAWDLKE
ncbi:MAG: hypothetical protein ACKVH8_23345 [Pirellulales bacterium]